MSALLLRPSPSYSSQHTVFLLPTLGVQGLPNWSLLQLAVHPVALMIQDCAAVAAVVASSSAKVCGLREAAGWMVWPVISAQRSMWGHSPSWLESGGAEHAPLLVPLNTSGYRRPCCCFCWLPPPLLLPLNIDGCPHPSPASCTDGG